MRNLYILFFVLLLCGSGFAQKAVKVRDDLYPTVMSDKSLVDTSVNPYKSQANSISVTLQWTAPGDDGNVGTATAYDIAFSTDSSLLVNNFAAANHLASPPAPQIAGTIQTAAVTGLEENVRYYFALKTVDEVGNWSELSNVAAVETLDITPPAAITDLEAM